MRLLAATFCCTLAAHGALVAGAEESDKPKVLIITADAEDQSHAFVKHALAPDKQIAKVEIEVAQADRLVGGRVGEFATIFLIDVPELSEKQRTSLSERVAAGAGVCVFLGPNAKIQHYNTHLYAAGKGVLPLPLGKPLDIPEGKTGIVAAKHPVLAEFQDGGKALLDIVLVTRSHTPAADWKAGDDKAVSVIARSRAGHPIAVSRPHGKGQAAVFFFVPDRRWANWHFYPAWVIMLHELQTFLTEY